MVAIPVGFNGGAGLAGDVEGGDLARAAQSAGEGKTALIAEAVENAFAPGLLGNEGIVGALVQVEAGFLSPGEVDTEIHAAEGDFEGCRCLATEDSDVRFQALGLADGSVIAFDKADRLENFFDRVGDEFFALVHGEGQRLQDRAVAIAVENKAGQSVAFAPDLAAGTRVESELVAVFRGHGDAAAEEVGIEVLTLARKAAGRDFRAAVVNGAAEKAVALVFEADNRAVFGFAGDLEDFVVVDPIVPVEDACAGADNDRCHGVRMGGTKPAIHVWPSRVGCPFSSRGWPRD